MSRFDAIFGDAGAGAGDEARLRAAFWDKVRHAAGRVPFLGDALAAYYCVLDPATPSRVRATLLAALAYFILPTDAVPDIFAGIGFTDDAGVIAAAIAMVGPHITAVHRAAAARALGRSAG